MSENKEPQVNQPLITVGTPEWDKLTDRREWLIIKRREGLTVEEAREFERLDAISEEAINRAFPAALPLINPDSFSTMTLSKKCITLVKWKV